MRALITAQLTRAAQESLRRDFGWNLTIDRDVLWRAASSHTLPSDLNQFDAVVVEADPISASTLEAFSRLRLLACVRGDPVNIDIEAATKRGIPVLYAPGRNAEAVADFTLGLILSTIRWIAPTHHLLMTRELTEENPSSAMKDRRDVTWVWRDRSRPHPYVLYKGPELKTQVLGVIGFGHIGKAVAQRARNLGMHVLVHDPFVESKSIVAAGCQATTLEDLLREADIVSLHARGTGTPLLGERELRQMKAGSYLINTARANLIDYDALYQVLRDGHLAGAGLDVFPIEPLPPDSPFLTLTNVTLTPHLAGASSNVVEHQSAIIIANIRALLYDRDKSNLAIKNPEVLEQWYTYYNNGRRGDRSLK